MYLDRQHPPVPTALAIFFFFLISHCFCYFDIFSGFLNLDVVTLFAQLPVFLYSLTSPFPFRGHTFTLLAEKNNAQIFHVYS